MSAIGLTPTRLALLRSIADGKVTRGFDTNDYDATSRRVVTARVRELARAGWCRRTGGTTIRGTWVLTDAGRAVLTAADQPAAVDSLRRQYCGGEP